MTDSFLQRPARLRSTQLVTSRDNPLVQRLRRLSQDPVAYRKQGEVWLEGDHLCEACLQRGIEVGLAVVAENAWLGEHGVAAGGDAQAVRLSALARQAEKVVVVPEALWKNFTGLESPARIGFVLTRPAADAAESALRAGVPTVVLDRVQDAGNVGSILRSASAFGFKQIVALKGTAALWSQKVLRAGMGAHFGLHLVEAASVEDVQSLQVPLIVTSSHQGTLIHEADLPWPCAWAMGHEGQGVGDALMDMAQHRISIAQPGGEESLNVGAAAAICLHASSVSMLKRRG